MLGSRAIDTVVSVASGESEGLRERIGAAIGRWWAPYVATISRARHGRMFHPEGHTYEGWVEPVLDNQLSPLGRELTGRVLVRLSAALWRGDFEHFDVLGMALRFRRGPSPVFDHVAHPGDTDLLTATIRSPLTMLASPFFTNAGDFTTNRYWAVSPFEHAVGRIEIRLVPDHPVHLQGNRVTKLARAVEMGRAAWWLEARRTLTLRWHHVARVQLENPVDLDQEALRFDPFRGILKPVGLVHAIRRATYTASQNARPESEEAL